MHGVVIIPFHFAFLLLEFHVSKTNIHCCHLTNLTTHFILNLFDSHFKRHEGGQYHHRLKYGD